MRANVQRSSDRENTSVLACVNADGDYAPPLFILSGVRRQATWANGTFDDAGWAMSDSSNVNGEIFYNWLIFFENFLIRKQMKKPCLLLLDGHFSHVNLKNISFAMEKQIHLFVLPSHTSHITQPLDDVVFQRLKRCFEKEVEKFPLSHNGAHPLKEHLPGLVTNAWIDSFSKLNIQKSFENTGVFPLNFSKIQEKIVGKAPKQLDFKYHKEFNVEEILNLSERQKKSLKRKGKLIKLLVYFFQKFNFFFFRFKFRCASDSIYWIESIKKYKSS